MKISIPQIPDWCIPWRARKRIASLKAALDCEYKRAEAEAAAALAASQKISEERAKQESIEAALQETKVVESKNKKAIGALLAWIYATHKIDQRADQHGLTDILKDFPNR